MTLNQLPDKLWVIRHPTEGILYALGTTPLEAWMGAIERAYGVTFEDRRYVKIREDLAKRGWRARRALITVEDL